MKSTIRVLLMGVILALFYQGVSLVLALGVDGEGPALARVLLQEARRQEALHHRKNEVTQSQDIKLAAVEDFIADRLSLAETIERFQEAGERIEKDPDGLVAPYLVPGTKAEVCSQVRVWLDSVLPGNHTPEEVEMILCRFEKEQQELFHTTELEVYPNLQKLPSRHSN